MLSKVFYSFSFFVWHLFHWSMFIYNFHYAVMQKSVFIIINVLYYVHFVSSLRPLNSFRNFSWSKCFKSFLCGLTFSLLRTDRSSKIRKFGKWSELFSRSLSLLHCKSLKFKYILSLVDHENDNEVKITNVIKSATSDITDAELTLVTKQIQKSCN